MNGDGHFLRISRKTGSCRVLGPGQRAAIWFYGCSRGCPGCIAESMNSSGEFTEETPESLYEWVDSCTGIEGVTLSGGEPFEQDPEQLLRFLRHVKKDPRGLGVICFTGFLKKELSGTKKEELFPYIDVLVDGPYRMEENNGSDLRGSGNQGIHFLTDRYREFETEFFGEKARNLEFELNMRGEIIINGIPRRGFVEKFTKEISASGYRLALGKENEK